MAEDARVDGASSSGAMQELNERLAEFARGLRVSSRVLVVDDEPPITELISLTLANRNIVCDQAHTSEEAIVKLETTAYAVAVVDKNMPGLDGIGLLKRIKQDWPRTEVLIITGYASMESALEAIQAGAFDYIPKPFDHVSHVADKITSALTRHDFEVRVQAMADHLRDQLKEMVVDMSQDEQRTWIQKLRKTLANIETDEDPGLILVMGSEAVSAGTARLGLRVSRVEKMEQVLETIRNQTVRLVVFQEGTDGLEGADVVGRLAQFAPELGVFVIAERTNMDKVVRAIGIGVADYVLIPPEGQEIYEARLRRLIARQQELCRTRRILDALKKISIDLLAPPPSGVVIEDRF